MHPETKDFRHLFWLFLLINRRNPADAPGYDFIHFTYVGRQYTVVKSYYNSVN